MQAAHSCCPSHPNSLRLLGRELQPSIRRKCYGWQRFDTRWVFATSSTNNGPLKIPPYQSFLGPLYFKNLISSSVWVKGFWQEAEDFLSPSFPKSQILPIKGSINQPSWSRFRGDNTCKVHFTCQTSALFQNIKGCFRTRCSLRTELACIYREL